MAKLDPFTTQIVQLVRKMPDEALLELVRNQLGLAPAPAGGAGLAGAAAPAPAAPAAPAPLRRKAAKRRAKARVKAKAAAVRPAAGPTLVAVAAPASPAPKKKARRKAAGKVQRSTSAERSGLIETVERTVLSSNGLSIGQIAQKLSLPKLRVQAAVRELKHAKRIFQGGDRRFARYAADAKTALKASHTARGL